MFALEIQIPREQIPSLKWMKSVYDIINKQFQFWSLPCSLSLSLLASTGADAIKWFSYSTLIEMTFGFNPTKQRTIDIYVRIIEIICWVTFLAKYFSPFLLQGFGLFTRKSFCLRSTASDFFCFGWAKTSNVSFSKYH
jgi:hypothetical protein